MKVEQGQPERFAPITIVLETQEEADIMWAMLNTPYTTAVQFSHNHKLTDNSIDGRTHLNMWRAFDNVYPSKG